MCAIMAYCEGKADWDNMDEYASKWESVNYKPGQTVYAGWLSNTGVGLYTSDVIRFVGAN